MNSRSNSDSCLVHVKDGVKLLERPEQMGSQKRSSGLNESSGRTPENCAIGSVAQTSGTLTITAQSHQCHFGALRFNLNQKITPNKTNSSLLPDPTEEDLPLQLDSMTSTMSQILHPAVIEIFCRRSIRSNPKHSLIAIRVALHPSINNGSQWFSVGEVLKHLSGGRKYLGGTGVVANRLTELGIIETKMISFPSYTRRDARLICETVDKNHILGLRSQRIRDDIEKYSETHPRSSQLIALLLSAIHLYGIHRSIELCQFLSPEFDISKTPSTATRMLTALSDAGVLQIVRDSPSMSRPFVVIPI